MTILVWFMQSGLRVQGSGESKKARHRRTLSMLYGANSSGWSESVLMGRGLAVRTV
jgi:hypothetical protein